MESKEQSGPLVLHTSPIASLAARPLPAARLLSGARPVTCANLYHAGSGDATPAAAKADPQSRAPLFPTGTLYT